VLLNKGPQKINVTANWDDIGIPPKTVVQARDLWEVIHCTFVYIQFMLFTMIY
jgi:hypothetical protein